MMIAVRKDVLAATGGNQVPWENSSLTRAVRLRPGEDARRARDPALAARRHRPRSGADAHLPRPLPRGPARRRTCAPCSPSEEPAPAGDVEVASRDLTPDDRALADLLWDVARRTPAAAAGRALPPANPDGAARRRRRGACSPTCRRPTTRTPRPSCVCERLATHDRDATANDRRRDPRPPRARTPPPPSRPAARRPPRIPEMPHYTALLARATYAAGDLAEARPALPRRRRRAATFAPWSASA